MQTEKVQLKLAKKHPRDAFRILDLVVDSYSYKEYEINEKHFHELQSPGGKAWVKCKEMEEAEEIEVEEESTELTDEEKEELAKAEELKANSENQNNPAPVEPTPAESQEAVEPTPELIDETKVIEDKPSEEKKKNKNKNS